MKKIRVIRKDSGLKSGSREVSFTEALKYPVYNLIQGKSVSYKAFKLSVFGLRISSSKRIISRKFEFSGKIKGTKESLSQKHSSNIGAPRAQLTVSFGGLVVFKP